MNAEPVFDPTVQTRHDGPLTDAFVARVRKAKKTHKLTMSDLARMWGISTPWAQRILSEDPEVRERNRPSTAQTIYYVTILNQLEGKSDKAAITLQKFTMDELLAEIESRGYEAFIRRKTPA